MSEIKFSYIQKTDDGFNEVIYSLDDLESGNVDRLILMQKERYGIIARRRFTGLKDKNGKDIYEGDIVIFTVGSRPYPGADDDEINYTYYRTKAHFDSGAFWLSGDGIATCLHFHYNAADREVIGNIYEHPELLEQKDAN